jgi:hypothetical protein
MSKQYLRSTYYQPIKNSRNIIIILINYIELNTRILLFRANNLVVTVSLLQIVQIRVAR